MRIVRLLLTLLFLFGSTSCPSAYDADTHREIARQSVQPEVSLLDGVLKDHLGMLEGTKEKLFRGTPQEQTVERLIVEGARSEDDPFTRVFNHFHNPLASQWQEAGLRAFLGTVRGQSSVLWQQNTNQHLSLVFTPAPFPSLGGKWSWQDTRRRYLDALTGETKEQREQAFEDTFLGLGHLAHLVQDATVPAHVRNDAHAPILNPDWYEDWVKETRATDPALFQGLLNSYNKDLHRPPFSLFMPTQNAQAPVPIARLLDSDKFLRLNFQVLIDPELGIAEYTSGNFLSRDTIFTSFDLPRRSSLDPNFIVEPVGAKFRRYLQKTSEGETITHFVTEGLLHNTLKEALGGAPVPAGGWTLDDKNVHVDYAAKLLPRAVGYSAALPDYFFHGKLDADLVEDPDNPSVLRVIGTNASTAPLVDGTLTLYADGPNGVRSQATALDSPTIANVAPGEKILPERRFQVPTADTERFVAVYQGTLGNEEKDPGKNFPGAVIGKVLGGMRVESIFPQGDKRLLRTVDGVFSLPSTADRLKKVQWGDRDNTFVGTLSKSDNPTSPDQVVAFQINRPLGSTEVPLIDGSDGTKVVSAGVLKAVDFPYGLSLGVTVDYSQTFHVQQLLFTFDFIQTLVWNGIDYNESHKITDPAEQVEVVVDKTVPFSLSFPIVLDQAHRFEAARFRRTNYAWEVEEVGLDSEGRLLALVRVELTVPEIDPVTIPFQSRDINGQLVDSTGAFQRFFVSGSFQVERCCLLWALIDVGKGEVLGVTSSPTVSLSSQHAHPRFLVQIHQKATISGGPAAGLGSESWGGPFSVSEKVFGFSTVETGTFTLPVEGVLSKTVRGHLRADLEVLVGTHGKISNVNFEDQFVYFFDPFSQINRATRFTSSATFEDGPIGPGPWAVLIRPTRGNHLEVLLLVRLQVPGTFGDSQEAMLIRWSPQSPSNTALAEKLPPVSFYEELLSATPDAAVLTADEDVDDESIEFGLLVDFTSSKSQKYVNHLDNFENRKFVLLAPKLLYNVDDLRFHTVDPSLRPTVLPRRLAAAPPISRFEAFDATYHVIPLR